MADFETAIAEHIWQTKYRYRQDGDASDVSVADTWRRVAFCHRRGRA